LPFGASQALRPAPSALEKRTMAAKRPVALQLYTLRERAQKDFVAVLRDVAAIGYAGVETAGLHGMSPAEFGKILNDLGLKLCSAHVPLPTSENVSQLVDMAKTLNCSMLVSGFGPAEFKTLDTIRAAAAKFQAAAELVGAHGIQLGYHNHYWEFDLVEGRYGFNWFFEMCPNVFSELDVYWACNFNRVDVPAVLKLHKKTVKLLHIKDGPLVQNEPHTAVGAGKMNMKAVIKAAPKEAAWLIVELDSCATDMTEAVRQSFDWLVRNRLGAGRS